MQYTLSDFSPEVFQPQGSVKQILEVKIKIKKDLFACAWL